jgi:two-component sensor histidine kinase
VIADNLLYEVYAFTLKRNLPYFKTIQVKVRNFAPLEQPTLTLEMKQDLCLWLEKALCNVGKHAQGTTRIVVLGSNPDKDNREQSHVTFWLNDWGDSFDENLCPREG